MSINLNGVTALVNVSKYPFEGMQGQLVTIKDNGDGTYGCLTSYGAGPGHSSHNIIERLVKDFSLLIVSVPRNQKGWESFGQYQSYAGFTDNQCEQIALVGAVFPHICFTLDNGIFRFITDGWFIDKLSGANYEVRKALEGKISKDEKNALYQHGTALSIHDVGPAAEWLFAFTCNYYQELSRGTLAGIGFSKLIEYVEAYLPIRNEWMKNYRKVMKSLFGEEMFNDVYRVYTTNEDGNDTTMDMFTNVDEAYQGRAVLIKLGMRAGFTKEV